MNSDNAPSFDFGLGTLCYDLAEFLGIPDPDEGLDQFDILNRDPDFSNWLRSTLWTALAENKAVFPRTLKLRILAGVYFAEDYDEFEGVRNRWDEVLDQFREVAPVVTDDEIDEFYEQHPECEFVGLF